MKWRAGAAALVLLGSCRAEAHLVTTGLGPVYDGIGHFVLSLEDLFPVLALALFGGLRGATSGRRTLFLLPAAWMAGGLLGLQLTPKPTPLLAPISCLLAGALVASDLRLSANAVAAVATSVGLVHGFLNGTTLRHQGAEIGALQLVGVITSLFAIVALAAALVVSLRRPWTRIAVRVAGSWIAAVGLLMLGWAVKQAS